MRKVSGIIAVIYVAALFQMSFLVHIFPNGLIPNFVVLGVIILAIFEKPESYASFTAALFSGLIMDIFSGGIIGLWAVILLGLSVTIKVILEHYVRFSIPQKF